MSNGISYDPGFLKKRWVGYFDLLGVKELCKTENPTSVFAAYHYAVENLEASGVNGWKENIDGYAWFSDTFIVYTKDDTAESFRAIDTVSQWFIYFLITSNTPASGAISCDTLYADRENALFFGKALIEAHEYGEDQDWIGLILCPSADKELKRLAQVSINYKNEDIPFKKLKGNLPACIIGRYSRNGKGQNPVIEHLEEMRAALDLNQRKHEEEIRAALDIDQRDYEEETRAALDINQRKYEKIKSKYDRTIEFLRKYDKLDNAQNFKYVPV